ncbi:MAG: ATP-dependent DNA helicase [Deltaproteobacteria bacterium]|nr:ATP-dependent DNA helicase [Deltaproteobacteria bacterium]
MSTSDPPKKKIPLPGSIPADTGELDYLLAKGGPLDLAWKDFQPREAQIKMFRETLRAMSQNDITIIEAGTGTGKTLAYLLAAIISGRKKIVISTAAKNLQDQILNKDMRFVRIYFECSVKATVLKGRSSYVCQMALKSVMRQKARNLTNPALAGKFRALEEWRQNTVTGETAELPPGLTRQKPFDRLPSSGDTCRGKACPANSFCYLMNARRKAAEARIVLVNHSLLTSALAMDENSELVVPAWDAIIIDEAHQLEKAATDAFSKWFSTKDVQAALEELHGILDRRLVELQKLRKGPSSPVVAHVMGIHRQSDDSHDILLRIESQLLKERSAGDAGDVQASYGELLWPDRLATERERWPDEKIAAREAVREELAKLGRGLIMLCQELERLDGELKPLYGKSAKALPGEKEDEDDDLMPVSRKLAAFAESVSFIAGPENPGYVYTLSAAKNNATLAAVPVDVSGFLRAKLFDFRQPVVITSATIAAKGKFDYFRDRLGVDRRVKPLVLQSPYDYKGRTVLYVPDSMPARDEEKRDGLYRPALAEEMRKLLEITRGRALVLFTSFKRLEWVHQKFKAGGTPWNLFRQGEGSPDRILEMFRNDVSSVLMATMSFWQGVNVPGESLTAVIIDKLPFPVPTEPVHQARCRILDKEGPDGWRGFWELSVPTMEITLKQGVGRLIRSAGDWGLMAILDPKIRKRYGKDFLESHHVGNLTSDISEVRKFFERMEGPRAPRPGPAPGPASPQGDDAGRFPSGSPQRMPLKTR